MYGAFLTLLASSRVTYCLMNRRQPYPQGLNSAFKMVAWRRPSQTAGHNKSIGHFHCFKMAVASDWLIYSCMICCLAESSLCHHGHFKYRETFGTRLRTGGGVWGKGRGCNYENWH